LLRVIRCRRRISTRARGARDRRSANRELVRWIALVHLQQQARQIPSLLRVERHYEPLALGRRNADDEPSVFLLRLKRP